MDATFTTQNSDCALSLTVVPSAPDLLSLRYRLLNHGAIPLYVCTYLYEPDAAGSVAAPSADLVYVQVVQGSVQLSKASMDLSFRADLRVLATPLLVPLTPGQVYEHALQLALPLLPYKVDGQRPGLAAPVPLPLSFAIGYFPTSSHLLAALERLDAQPGAYELLSAQDNAQKLLTLGPLSVQVPVVDSLADTVPAAPVSPAQWTPWN